MYALRHESVHSQTRSEDRKSVSFVPTSNKEPQGNVS
jgi:hypothetical protein